MRTVVLVCVLAGCVDVDTATIGEPIIHGAVDTTHGAVVAVINTTMGFSCSGTVIAVDGVTAVVLTAAHCAPADIVLTGDDYATPTATYAVTDILVHPAYNDQNFLFDYSLMRIAGVPVDLPSIPALTPAEDALAVGDPLTLVGYGVTSATGSSNTIRHHFAGTVDQLTLTSIGFSNATGGTCSGDSGGPALTTGTERVAGVTSYGDINCEAFGFDGRVSSVYDSFIAPYLTGVPAVDAAPGPTPDAAPGRDASGNPDSGDGGGCCDSSGRGATGSLLLAALVALSGRRRARPGRRSGSG